MLSINLVFIHKGQLIIFDQALNVSWVTTSWFDVEINEIAEDVIYSYYALAGWDEVQFPR